MNEFILPESLWEDDSYFRDPEYRVGRLDNGLKYYIRHNNEPEHRCLMEVIHRVGSMQEEEEQRGLAHLLEHLGFSHLRHTPDKDVREYLEQFGIEGGGVLNAATSRHYTYYYINNIPTDQGSDVMEACINVLQDWSNGFLLTDSDIANERGIVKNEYLRGKTASSRMYDQVWETVTQNHRSSYRKPIGLLDVIENAPNSAIRDFYNKWYHPANQAVVIIGDVDVDIMEARVKSLFGAIEPNENPAPVCEYPMYENSEPIFACASDKEYHNSQIVVYSKFPNPFRNTSGVAHHLYIDIMLTLIRSMIHKRLYNIRMGKDSNIISTDTRISAFEGSKDMHIMELSCVVSPGHEEEGYRALMKTMVSVLKSGFNAQELKMQVDYLLNVFERAYMERSHNSNSDYEDDCFDNFLRNNPLSSDESAYNYSKRLLDSVDLDVLNKIFRSIVSECGKNMITVVYTKPAEELDEIKNEDFYRNIAMDVYANTSAEPDNSQEDLVLIPNLPNPGSVVSDEVVSELDFHVLTLSNGARVIYKKTDFMEDEIKFRIAADGGTSQFGVEEFPNFRVMDEVLLHVGLGDFSEVQFSKYFNAKSFNIDYDVYEALQILQGTGSARDLESLMEIIYCFFTNPGHNADDFGLWKKRKYESIISYSQNPKNALSLRRDILRLVDRSRVHYLTLEELEKVDLERILQLHKILFEDVSHFTFLFVGSINVDEFTRLLEKYIAVLPSGKGNNHMCIEAFRDTQRVVCDFSEVEMVDPISYLGHVYESNQLQYSFKNRLLALLMTGILNDRIYNRVRTQSQISYSCGADVRLYRNYRNDDLMRITIQTGAEVQPEYGILANGLINSEIDKLIANGVTDQELDVQRKRRIQIHQNCLRDNKSWLFYVRTFLERQMNVVSDFQSLIDSITVDDVNEFVRSFFAESNIQKYVAMPRGVEQLDKLPEK